MYLFPYKRNDLSFQNLPQTPWPPDIPQIASYSVNADDFCALFQFCDITRLLTKSTSASINFFVNIVGNGDIERMEKLLALPFAHMFDFDQRARSLAGCADPNAGYGDHASWSIGSPTTLVNTQTRVDS
jgi:hypothetical protein